MADRRAELQPAHHAYQEPFLHMIKFGGALVTDSIDTSVSVDIRDVAGNLLVFEVPDRATVENFHANDPYTLHDLFETASIEKIWQRVPDPGKG
jgi:hypothetical protein